MTENPSRQAALFLQLLLGLQQNGMMALGKLVNPLTRQIEKNLEAARDTIDMLTAIEARTQGNLESDEARVLRQVLTELRMNYLDELKRSGAPLPAPEPAAAGPPPTARDAAPAPEPAPAPPEPRATAPDAAAPESGQPARPAQEQADHRL
jgi:hypothetical protein